jgi:hypothetical protein
LLTGEVASTSQKVLGGFDKESGMLIIEGFACTKPKLFCKDARNGTMKWEDRESLCSKTNIEVYTGNAELDNGKHNSSRIIVIGNKGQDNYVAHE